MKTYLVGGAVRDQLLKRSVKDNDWVVVGATPDEMIQLGYQQVGADFPVFLHPTTKEEYALARTERKSGKGYQGFVCDFSSNVTLEDDLLRRDLTINAMAQDEKGQITDPFDGQRDLKEKRLRHVSPAFQEDPLRVLRVARFCARFAHLGFHVADETMELMKKMVSDKELDHLVAERVWVETQRALTEVSPDVYFRVLRECGALKVWFTELDNLFGIPQSSQNNSEMDAGEYALLCLQVAQSLSKQIPVRWAALTHSIGKCSPEKSEWPHNSGDEAATPTLLEQLCNRLKAPNDVKTLAMLSNKFHTCVYRASELDPEKLLALFDQLDAWRRPERFEDFLLVCVATACSQHGTKQNGDSQADYCRAALQEALTIQAKDMMAQGVQGAEIRPALQRARAEHLKDWKSSQGLPE